MVDHLFNDTKKFNYPLPTATASKLADHMGSSESKMKSPKRHAGLEEGNWENGKL